MKGNIYTQERCAVCGGMLVHDSNIDGFICESGHRTIPRNMMVKFGRKVTKRFSKSRYDLARQFLDGLRFKSYEGSFDFRDYRADNPLGFDVQVETYLEIKKKKVKPGAFRNIKNYLHRAAVAWGPTNVKNIGYAQIEDFLYKRLIGISDKTRANAKSALSDFYKWLGKREGVPFPDMPDCDFELGWRNIIDIDTQQAIIAEVKRITWDINPRIWIGIKWLSTYIGIRPNELRNLKEREIDVSGFFVIPSPKEKAPKLVAMIQEDIDLYHSIEPRGLPDLYFFRHIKGNGSAKPGQQFGKDFLYVWWKKACANLGIEGVDLYGGTRHSTATALGEHFSEAEIMAAGSMHKSNKAARRYIQAQKNKSIDIYTKAREIQGGGKIIDVGLMFLGKGKKPRQ